MGNDNGSGQSAGRKSLVAKNVDEYRELLEDLDHAWAMMTESERSEFESEVNRRRSANPNWPYMTSDHSDRLTGRVIELTRAATLLERSITGADGMVMAMRASTSAIDMTRDQLELHTAALKENTAVSERVIEVLERLCSALEPRPA